VGFIPLTTKSAARPPNIPGKPCRYKTPQVSVFFIFVCNACHLRWFNIRISV
jgi:hypothetical protein